MADKQEWFPGTEGTHFAGSRLAEECHGFDLNGNPTGPLFDLDGEPLNVTIDTFIAENEFEDAEIAAIRELSIGGEVRFGGGAMPITILRRVA